MSTRSWTPEQLSVLEHSGAGLAVTAGAGAGKTTTLVEKCVRVLEGRADARLCAVSFTERSAGDLRDKLSRTLRERGLPFEASRHWITTIHGLCGLILREFPLEAGFQGDERVLSELETSRLWNRALEGLWKEERGDSNDLQLLLSREGRKGTESLMVRFRELEGSGVLARAAESDQPELVAASAVAGRVLSRYHQFKRRASGLDFSDLERAAQRALEFESVRRTLQARFALVLVDEFQDTNPVQAQILWQIIREDRSNLCVVGDPKQSIYRFRDADVTLFEELSRGLPTRRSLTWNFRSHPEVLVRVNELCEPLFAASALEYEPLTPGRQAEEFSLSEGEPAVARLDVENPEAFAAWIESEVARGIPLESMAILMRRVRGMESWIQALSRRGIPLAVGGGGLFWQDPRVLELVALLRWWAFPADEWAGLEFLSAPWTGVNFSNLDEWKGTGSLGEFWNSELPASRALRELRSHRMTLRPGEILARLLDSAELSAEMDELARPLLSLWIRCEQLSLQGAGFHEVVRRLADSVEKGRREKEVPPPANRGVLQIMTVHASKGLEFERVYLVDFGKKSRALSSPILFTDRHRGVYLAPRTEDGARDDRNALYREWKELERSASVSESKRQFYVALTRAKTQLVFVCEEIDPEKGFERDRDVALKVDHWRGWLEHLGSSIPRLEHPATISSSAAFFRSSNESEGVDSNPAGQPKLAPTPATRLRHGVTEWTLLARCERSYAAMMADAAGTLEEGPARESGWEVEPPASKGLAANELGKRVHAVIEKWHLTGEADTQELTLLEQSAGPGRFSSRVLLEWMKQESARDDLARGYSELPVEWKLGESLLVGVIDRVEQLREPGAWRITDYKIFSKRKSDRELLSLYSAQLDLYAGTLLRIAGLEKCSRLETRLVQITPEGVHETIHTVDRLKLLDAAEARARQAERVIRRVQDPEFQFGEFSAVPGSACRHCRLAERCPDWMAT